MLDDYIQTDAKLQMKSKFYQPISQADYLIQLIFFNIFDGAVYLHPYYFLYNIKSNKQPK